MSARRTRLSRLHNYFRAYPSTGRWERVVHAPSAHGLTVADQIHIDGVMIRRAMDAEALAALSLEMLDSRGHELAALVARVASLTAADATCAPPPPTPYRATPRAPRAPAAA
ncbi:hypothetical protein AAIB33_06430 [Microbacterium sp. AZCO]|uniref:hypothetical protein n=1 Tax=Microbacterium sp. AZCO TaxID=3142976 RepID=UPI0031F39743